jgi:hypothetical protein
MPLSEVYSVVVFTDDAEAGLEPLKVAIKSFFAKGGAVVRFIRADDEDLRTSSDMFVALNSRPSIDERYAAMSSGARFKIGRHQFPGQVYDLVVADPGEEPASATEAFTLIQQLITSIK